MGRAMRALGTNPVRDDKLTRDTVVLFQTLTILFMISTVLVWQIRGSGRISIAVFFLAIVASVCAVIFGIRKPLERKAAKNSLLLLIVSVLFVALLFVNRVEACEFLQNKQYGMILAPELYCGSIIITLSFLIQLIVYFGRNSHCLRDSITGFRGYRIVYCGVYAGVVLFIILVGAQFVGQWFRWDELAYYIPMRGLSISNLFEPGRLGLVSGGHPESAYVLSVLIIQSVSGSSVLDAMYISNIVATVLAFILCVMLFKAIFPSRHELVYLCIGGLFVCNPYILGSVDKLNPEHLCVASMLLFLVGVARKNDILCLIGCFGVCNTRENAALVIAVVILAQYVIEVFDSFRAGSPHDYEKRGFQRVRLAFKNVDYLHYGTLLIIGVLWLLVYLNIDWVEHMQQSSSHEYYYIDGTRFFGVAISPLFILNQFKAIFLSNFTWVYAIAIVLCIAIQRHLNKGENGRQSNMQRKVCSLLVVGCICAIGVQSVFITYHNYRYFTLSVAFVLLICLYFILLLALRHSVRLKHCMICALIIGLLPLGQCFRTIDPVMLAIFPSFSTGDSRLVTSPWYISGYPDNDRLLQSARYNFQVSYFDDALDMAYSKMDLDNTKILIYDGYSWGDRSNTFGTIYGFGYYNYGLYSSWNEAAKKRELNGTKEDNVDPVVVSSVSDIEKYVGKFDHVYYIEFPWGDDLAKEFNSMSSVSIDHVDTVEYGGWVLQLYEFSPLAR